MVTVSDAEISLTLELGHPLQAAGSCSLSSLRSVTLLLAATWVTFGHERRLRLDPSAGAEAKPDGKLVELIVRAFAAREQLLAMSDADVAAMPQTSLRYLERTARLSYLAPDIVTAILDGAQPSTLTARHLVRMASLPLGWAEQRVALRLTAG